MQVDSQTHKQEKKEIFSQGNTPSSIDATITISAGTTDALPGRQCEYHCHFDWYGNCYDQSCYDCVGCVQLRTPRPPPAPRYPPPPTPMQVVKPLWCLELSGRGDALKQDPPLMCPELDHDDCSKFYVFFHGVSIPCMWTEVRRRAASTLDRSPLSALLSQLSALCSQLSALSSQLSSLSFQLSSLSSQL